MTPTWLPKWSLSHEKNDAKNNQKIDAFPDRLFLDFIRFWMEKWTQIGSKLNQKRCQLLKPFFSKIELSLERELDFAKSRGRSWEPKSIKNRRRHEVEKEKHLSIDFLKILMDFGSQDGVKKRVKNDKKNIEN